MKPVRLSLRGGDFDVREAARAAARRTGLSLGEWLEAAIAARASRLGAAPGELSDAEKIDAVAERLGSLTLDEPQASPMRADNDHDAAPRRRDADLRLLDAAAATLGLRRDRDDVRDVARQISELDQALGRAPRRSAADAPADDHRLRRIADGLAISPAAQAPWRDFERIEQRLDLILDAVERAPHRPSADADLRALREQVEDLSRAVAAIGERAAKQSLEPLVLDLLRRVDASRASGVDADALVPVMDMLIEIRSAVEHSPVIATRAMGAELEALQARLEALERGAPRGEIEALRGDVRDMAREIADVAMRLGSHEALHRQLALLLQRLEAIAEAPRQLAARLLDLAEHLRDWVERLDASEGLRALEARLDDVTARQDEAYPAIAGSLAELREAVHDLADSPAFADMRRRMDELQRLTGDMPEALVETLDDMRRSITRLAENPALAPDAPRVGPLPGAIAETLGEIRLSIERLGANAGLRSAEETAARLQTIEERVAQIARKLDEHPPGAERFAHLQETLLSGIDRLRREIVAEQIPALQQRVAEVHRAVAQTDTVAGVPAGLEAIVSQLAGRLERAAAAHAQDPRALQAIENQVQRIAERLERHGETGETLSALERGMSELAAQVDEARHVAREAASARTGDSDSERQTRATLEAVHETLEKVVDRLALIEGEVGSLRAGAAPTPVAANAPASAAAAPQTTTERAAPQPVVQHAESASAASAPVMPAPSREDALRQDLALEFSEPRAAQQSFIAAARRATQMMSGARPAVRTDADRDAAGVEASGAASLTAPRKLMIGVAGLALTLGGYSWLREAQETPAPQVEVSVAPAQDEGETSAPSAQTQAAAPLPPAETAAPLAATDPMPVGSIARSDLALSLLKDLAAKGNAAAQYEYASRLAEGRSVTRDPVQAAQWFQKSAEQDYAPAQYRLGALYERGSGVARSLRTAALWYAKAAQAGHVRAMHNYGVLLADGFDGKPDYALAASMFRRAAERGLRDSQFNLAVLYMRGLGVPSDLVESYKWLALASAQGDTDALARREEVGARLDPLQLSKARKAAESFALLTPDPAANEPLSFDTIVAGPRASATKDPAAATARNASADQITSLAR